MKLIVLISCMHEKDHSIIERSNVQTDVVVVNQCDKDSVDEFDFKNKQGENCHAKFINTTERGLSRSRNMALLNSWGDVCYICDDDEILQDDYENIIMKAYCNYPQMSIITFSLIRKNYNYPTEIKKMGIKEILRTSSVQTTFNRNEIIKREIFFDIKMGSGSGNGGGEENKFLMDCKRHGLKMLYIPNVIATVGSEKSQWFHGFNAKYFEDTFWAARRSLGLLLGFVYLLYWCLIRSNKFDIKINKVTMIKYGLKGFFQGR